MKTKLILNSTTKSCIELGEKMSKCLLAILYKDHLQNKNLSFEELPMSK